MQDIFPFDHGKSMVKKFRQNDKVHSNVIFPGRQDFLRSILIQEKEIPFL